MFAVCHLASESPATSGVDSGMHPISPISSGAIPISESAVVIGSRDADFPTDPQSLQ